MNAVMGMTSLLLHKKPREDQFYYLNGIKKSSDNLLRIINDILDLSKIEAGKMELEKIDFSLADLIGQVVMTLQHKADEKGLRLISHIARDIPDIVIGDPVRINQVLMNLVGNAIKFTEKGSVEIAVSQDSGSAAIHFSVIDTGTGIPKDKLQKVFESFSQANAADTRKHGGTGLGLTISQELVGLMGGQLAVDSREGFGTTFSFSLNLETGSGERLQQRLAAEERLDGTALNGLSILIVDDNEFNLTVAKDSLEFDSDAVVFAVDSAQKAFDLLKERRFDVILMDVQMPEMNGFDATKYIREHFEEPVRDIPIIALTASVLRTDLDKCKEVGMNSYIAKPFKLGDLIAGIAEVVQIRKS
jgi:CheY-like chemotaxis protein